MLTNNVETRALVPSRRAFIKAAPAAAVLAATGATRTCTLRPRTAMQRSPTPPSMMTTRASLSDGSGTISGRRLGRVRHDDSARDDDRRRTGFGGIASGSGSGARRARADGRVLPAVRRGAGCDRPR